MKFITPALRQAGWDEMLQIREEVGFNHQGPHQLALPVDFVTGKTYTIM